MSTAHRITAAPLHESTRTSISKNCDPETGAQTQVLTTSRLRLDWLHGELRVSFECSRVELGGKRAERIPRSPKRA